MAQSILFGMALILISTPVLALSVPNVRFLYYKLTSANGDELCKRVINYHKHSKSRQFSIYNLFGPKLRAYMWTVGFAIMTVLAANSIFDLHLLK